MKISHNRRTYVKMCFSCPGEGVAGTFFASEDSAEEDTARMTAEILKSLAHGAPTTSPIRFEIYPEDDHSDSSSWIFQISVNPETDIPETHVQRRITGI